MAVSKLGKFFGGLTQVVGSVWGCTFGVFDKLFVDDPYMKTGNNYLIYGIGSTPLGATKARTNAFIPRWLDVIDLVDAGIYEQDFSHIPATTKDNFDLNLRGKVSLEIDGRKGAIEYWERGKELIDYATELVTRYTADYINSYSEEGLEGKMVKIGNKIRDYYTKSDGAKVLKRLGLKLRNITLNSEFDDYAKGIRSIVPGEEREAKAREMRAKSEAKVAAIQSASNIKQAKYAKATSRILDGDENAYRILKNENDQAIAKGVSEQKHINSVAFAFGDSQKTPLYIPQRPAPAPEPTPTTPQIKEKNDLGDLVKDMNPEEKKTAEYLNAPYAADGHEYSEAA